MVVSVVGCVFVCSCYWLGEVLVWIYVLAYVYVCLVCVFLLLVVTPQIPVRTL